jgi:hypothetical protein
MMVAFLKSASTPARGGPCGPDRPGARRSRNLLARGAGEVGAVVLAVAGVLAAPEPAANAEVPLADWVSHVAPHVADIHKAENAAFAIIQAPGVIDGDKLQSNCTQLRDANERLRDGMPTPDPKLTVEVQQAIDNFDSASQSCIESVATRKMAKLDDFVSFLRTAEQHFSSADTILVALAPAG